MKIKQALLLNSFCVLLLASAPSFAVDSESLADELKKLRNTPTADSASNQTQPEQAPVNYPQPRNENRRHSH